MRKIFLIISILLLITSCKNNKILNSNYKGDLGSFLNSRNLGVSKLPILLEGGIGVEAPLDIPDTKEKLIHYDSCSVYKAIYILNLNQSFEKLKLTLKDPEGVIYENIYDKDKLELIKDTYNPDPMQTENIIFKTPVIRISFNNQSCFKDGKWLGTVFIDDKEIIKNEIDINMLGPTVIPTERINPLKELDDFTFNKNETVYIYDNNKEINKLYIIAIYYLTEKVEKYQKIYDPIIATQVKSDNNGKIKAKYKIGKDLPSGNYLVVTGEEIKERPYFYGNFTIK